MILSFGKLRRRLSEPDRRGVRAFVGGGFTCGRGGRGGVRGVLAACQVTVVFLASGRSLDLRFEGERAWECPDGAIAVFSLFEASGLIHGESHKVQGELVRVGWWWRCLVGCRVLAVTEVLHVDRHALRGVGWPVSATWAGQEQSRVAEHVAQSGRGTMARKLRAWMPAGCGGGGGCADGSWCGTAQ
jgi:hypothetical protein